MKYQINYTDNRTGATSEIDTVHENPGFTAEDYLASCRKYADQEWNDMLDAGTVTVLNVTEYHVKPDHFHLWGDDVDEKTVFSYDDVADLAEEWEKPIEELLEQLEEI